MAGTAERRLIAAEYADGLSEPWGGFESTADSSCLSDTEQSLPNAREVSSIIHTLSDDAHQRASHMLTFFGQFLAHDIIFTPEAELDVESCCGSRMGESKTFEGNCFPIDVPCKDKYHVRQELNWSCNGTDSEKESVDIEQTLQ